MELAGMLPQHHEGHHHHEPVITGVNRILIIGILLNLLFVIAEALAGFLNHSLALLTDAGHNLGDAAGLALALLAFRLSRIRSNDKFTYGYQKTTVLVALLNTVILLIAIGSIGIEALHRLVHPVQVRGMVVAAVAGAGIFINGGTAWLFARESKKELNMRSAYLHMTADALVSLGVVAAGIVMAYTGWYWMDSLVSFAIMIVILISTWGVLSDSLRLSLDGVPRNIDIQEVERAARNVEGVKDIHHVHIWAMSTTQNALTAHVVIDKTAGLTGAGMILHQLRHTMEHLNIQHSTFEMETGPGDCGEKTC